MPRTHTVPHGLRLPAVPRIWFTFVIWILFLGCRIWFVGCRSDTQFTHSRSICWISPHLPTLYHPPRVLQFRVGCVWLRFAALPFLRFCPYYHRLPAMTPPTTPPAERVCVTNTPPYSPAVYPAPLVPTSAYVVNHDITITHYRHHIGSPHASDHPLPGAHAFTVHLVLHRGCARCCGSVPVWLAVAFIQFARLLRFDTLLPFTTLP